MFGIGMMEIYIVLGVGVLFFGGKKIPELAKGMGSGIREFRGAIKEVEEIPELIEDDDDA